VGTEDLGLSRAQALSSDQWLGQAVKVHRGYDDELCMLGEDGVGVLADGLAPCLCVRQEDDDLPYHWVAHEHVLPAQQQGALTVCVYPS
jgi:hypothetical protein